MYYSSFRSTDSVFLISTGLLFLYHVQSVSTNFYGITTLLFIFLHFFDHAFPILQTITAVIFLAVYQRYSLLLYNRSLPINFADQQIPYIFYTIKVFILFVSIHVPCVLVTGYLFTRVYYDLHYSRRLYCTIYIHIAMLRSTNTCVDFFACTNVTLLLNILVGVG